MKKLKYTLFVLIILLLIPLLSWFLWRVSPPKHLQVMIMDKSVSDMKRSSHRPLVWNLNHLRCVKEDGKTYSLLHDYYGFIPIAPFKSRNYDINRIRISDIEGMSVKYDLTYYADTRGVDYDEWFSNKKEQSGSLMIIGGLNQNDYLFLKAMIDQGKTVIAEHEFLGGVTDPLITRKAESLFHIDYTNWTGRYYARLDTSRNPELYPWIVSAYKKNNDGKWPFKGPGIILNRGKNVVVVLEKKDLLSLLPFIVTNPEKTREYQLPDSIGFAGSFEISIPDSLNEVFAHFFLNASESGLKKLKDNGVPSEFPAILHSITKPADIWYFCGDFSHYKMPYFTYRFKGWGHLMHFHKAESPSGFIWNYYMPLTKRIFLDTQKRLHAGPQ